MEMGGDWEGLIVQSAVVGERVLMMTVVLADLLNQGLWFCWSVVAVNSFYIVENILSVGDKLT